MTTNKQDTKLLKSHHKHDHHTDQAPQQFPNYSPTSFIHPQHLGMVVTSVPLSRPHPHAPAHPLHDVGFGSQPLFGWASVHPIPHSYGQPKYWRYQKPDYRRFCYSVGKAEVPYAALPGGPLHGYPTYMSESLVRRW